MKALYLKSQDYLIRNELDSRNSVVRVVDFYDKVTEIFNNENVSAVTTVLHDLHEDFAQPIDCPILDYKMSRIRPKLAKMIHNYELSGSGAGMMREEDNEMYRHFDPDKCVDGDDRRSFLLNINESWLLYWWDRLDKEGMLQFTICILDKFQRANAETFALVARERSTKVSTSVAADAEKTVLARNVAVVGKGVKSLSYATIFREIETCEEKVCNLELLLLEVEDSDDDTFASEGS